MDDPIRIFDFKRIFLGEDPPLFLLEIVFRTLIMYIYTILLLRVLGKRGMAQLSTLEVAIIICFGSAVGDPMIGSQVPILYGIVAITTVALLQRLMERVINVSPPLERGMEGEPNLVVEDGIVIIDALEKENLSHEDLYRALRTKDVQQLGEIDKAFFETSGQITVWFYPPRKVKKGLSILPENQLPPDSLFESGAIAPEDDFYSCRQCGHTRELKQGEKIDCCPQCGCERWLKNS
jgi:uncharacterized membrane protein YcaP (DUF421 family)